MILKGQLKTFNGYEETIENFQWFWRTSLPLNVFWYSDHCQRWFFNGFWVAQPLASMVFDGQGPLVKLWNGFNGSNRSSASVGLWVHIMDLIPARYTNSSKKLGHVKICDMKETRSCGKTGQ